MTGCLLYVMSADAREAFPFLPTFVPNARSQAAVLEQRAPVVPAGLSCQALAGPLLSGTAARPHFLQTFFPLATAFFRILQGGHRVFQELPAHRSPTWKPSSPPASLPRAATMSTAAIFS